MCSLTCVYCICLLFPVMLSLLHVVRCFLFVVYHVVVCHVVVWFVYCCGFTFCVVCCSLCVSCCVFVFCLLRVGLLLLCFMFSVCSLRLFLLVVACSLFVVVRLLFSVHRSLLVVLCWLFLVIGSFFRCYALCVSAF